MRERKYAILDVRDVLASSRAALLLELAYQLVRVEVLMILYLERVTLRCGRQTIFQVGFLFPHLFHLIFGGPEAAYFGLEKQVTLR